MTGIRLWGLFAGLLFPVALLGCGSGGGDGDGGSPPLAKGELTVTSTQLVNGDSANLLGSAFLTKNASCEGRSITNAQGGVTGFACDCTDDGSGRVAWTNTTTGVSGTGTYRVNGGNFPQEPCVQRDSRWSAILVPLAPGANSITVTMQDSQTMGSVSATVTRN